MYGASKKKRLRLPQLRMLHRLQSTAQHLSRQLHDVLARLVAKQPLPEEQVGAPKLVGPPEELKMTSLTPETTRNKYTVIPYTTEDFFNCKAVYWGLGI